MITRLKWLCLFMLGMVGMALATSVSIQLPVPGYDLYYVGDLDPRGDLSGVGNEISVTMNIDQPGSYNMTVELKFGEVWVVRGNLQADNVPPDNYGPWTLAQIRQGNMLGGVFHGNGEFNDSFIDQISGNALPTGVYTVLVRFLPPSPNANTETSGAFIINDPRRIDLQMPWDNSAVFTDQPNFAWSGRASNYRLRVCEYDPEFHSSAQEAIAGNPMWVAEMPATSAIYGQGGGSARPLVPGRQYVWMVEALLRTTSGDRTFASPIRTFRLNQTDGGQERQSLTSLLGGLTPSQLAGLGNLLEQYRLNGQIMVDGRPVSLEEFQQLLQQLASGQLNISSIRIE